MGRISLAGVRTRTHRRTPHGLMLTHDAHRPAGNGVHDHPHPHPRPRPETARTPRPFRDRVIAQFQSAENIVYLRRLLTESVPSAASRVFVLKTLDAAVRQFASGEGRALDVLRSDPIAQRGEARPALDFWAEVRRLNTAFRADRLAMLRDNAAMLEGGPPDDEPYHMRMFIADSLRPPGLEHLNAAGPLFALREDQLLAPPATPQIAAARRGGAVIIGESFAPKPAGAGATAPAPAALREVMPPRARARALPRAHASAPATTLAAAPVSATPPAKTFERFGVLRTMAPAAASAVGPALYHIGGDPDEAWDSEGSAARTAEAAVAAYYGSDWVSSETAISAAEESKNPIGAGGDDPALWSNARAAEEGTQRRSRYETIPFWQKGGRGGVDRDIEETLGTASRELGNPVRRWDMDRVRNPQGQEYRRYAARD
jgi:hypothetical protein